MGKKKQAQRTKNNVVPASSGRSAELLQSTSGMPFAGFSTLKDGGFIPILTGGISDELDTNINEEFRLVWKKMHKKDPTTKLKALDEFKRLCQSSDVEALKPVLPYWPRLFCTLSTDEEHRVRESAHAAHRELVRKAGRNIAPFLKQLVGPWFTGQHDTYPPAASTAETSFQETFPPNKLIEAIVFCQEEILNYICNNLLNQTPQTLATNQNCSQDVKDARYQRVMVSCLNGYALYLQRLPIEHLRKAEEANRQLVSSAKFWKFNKDPAAIVRAAWFTALVALCEKAPFLLAGEAKHVCTAVFSNIEETDPSVVHSVWQAVLLTFTVVEDVWKHVSLEKLVLPKLWKVLREGADGNASLIYPNLLPLLSKIPPALLPDRAAFYSKFFDNLRTGLKARNVQISGKETSAVITACLECLRYLISINCEDMTLSLSLFEQQVFPLLETMVSDPKLQLARPCLFTGLASLVNCWSKQSAPLYTSLTTSFWAWLATMSRSLLQDHVTDAAVLASNCGALETLLTAIKNPDVQPRKSFKVKFVSPRKSQDDETVNLSSVTEQGPLAPSFEEQRLQFINVQLSVCFNAMKSCGARAKVVLVGYFARIVEEYESADMYRHVLSTSELTWEGLYRQVLAGWLRDESIPLDYSLRTIFTLLKYVEDDSDVQLVYSDLSGEETLAVTGVEGEPQLEPLHVKWQNILQWALTPEHQTDCVLRWVQCHGGVCKLATLLSRQDPSYNILHNCLRNLRLNALLTTSSLREVVRSLRHNLLDAAISVEVKECSTDLLNAMLQNPANHTTLAQLPSDDLRALLYELLTAELQGLEPFPSCWHQCLEVLALKDTPRVSAVCEVCVDYVVAVLKVRTFNLAETQQLVGILEKLMMIGVRWKQQEEDSVASMVGVVLRRLSAKLRHYEEAAWSLYAEAEYVTGALRTTPALSTHTRSATAKDLLASVPVQEYVTGMIPFLVTVVRLQTTATTDDSTDEFPYGQLRAVLPPEDLWDWSLQVLQLHSFCVSFKNHFASTKQYFLLKDKVTFILEECGLFSQLRVRDLIRHLDLSLFDEGTSSLLQSDSLVMLQRQVVVKDLGLLYDVQQVHKDLINFKSRSTIVKHNFFPDEALEQLAANESLDKGNLPIINTCCRHLLSLREDSDKTTPISILDRVFDQYVAEEKENRSLLNLSEEQLNHIAEVADFACHSVTHDSIHMKQSSWDACLVATAALALSVSTTLGEWGKRTRPAPPLPVETPALSPPPAWPMSLLKESETTVEEITEEWLPLPLVRVVCSVCRLFDAVSTEVSRPDPEDKAAVTRSTEWGEVFLPGTHAAITQAWRTVAELPCDRPMMVLLTEALSVSVNQFVQFPHFVEGNDTLGCLDVCCRLLQCSESCVQQAAYMLLLRLIPAMIELDMKECEKDNVALSCQHVDQALVYTQSIIDVILSGLGFGDSCIIEPFTDSYTYTRCYLLLWCALLELCASACSQLRALYTTWLTEEYLPVFLKTVFCLMPEMVLHGEVVSQRLLSLFSQPPQLDRVGVWNSDRLTHLSCWVYACGLRRLPAAIRQWWNEADHRVYTLVEQVTATYISPDLCTEEMRALQSQEKKFDNMTVHVHPTSKEVYAVYTVEECRMELVIELAHNHPLGLVKVKSGQRMVSTSQTRQWLLQITIFLTHQNGSIWDALELWKNNLDKRFEGVEECYICFAILHSVSHQLPKLSCQTCRKKFHSHCLFKWFTTSNKSTCPICRNLF